MAKKLLYDVAIFAILAAPTFSAAAPATAQAQTRVDRLIQLDATYRSQGWQGWLKAVGVQCDSVVEARQPEEETLVGSDGTTHIVVSGLQLNGTCSVNWPAIVTTDHASYITTTAATRQYQPDLRNQSVLYTNVVANGPVTVWADGTNWGQLTPAGENVAPVVAPAPVVPTTTSTWWDKIKNLILPLCGGLLLLVLAGLIIWWLLSRNREPTPRARQAPPAPQAQPPATERPVWMDRDRHDTPEA